MKRRQRGLVMLSSLLAHGALLAALLRPAASLEVRAEPMVMPVTLADAPMAFSRSLKPTPNPLHAETPSPAPTKPRQLPPSPTDVTPQYLDYEPGADPQRLSADPKQDPVALSVATAADAGGACQVGAWLRQALQADPQVAAALASIPRSARSVANAVMIWDARWVAQPPTAAPGVSIVRTAIMVGIRSAPAACQNETVRGPELIALPDPSGTVLLAVGSGEWRWGDLLAEPENPKVIAANAGRP